ncbi:YhaN family protein [Marinobacter goseongensis]|uniref:YhaN family protein n=1 Tax=Marinobacter goseongensis TaxID=453838 RepID=UPI002002A2D9|nr:YhaN family protein [Marinobacter goseongensis]MCK7553145.1 AAA family ATPase [Marinobacter goseongensis]
MKLLKITLDAYGRFDGLELDFESPSNQGNLNLIVGWNEAGKSTALRAMSDLRFGIPQRSAMNFRFDSAQLSITGIFERADGSRIGLTRLKKRKGDLLSFHPDNPDQTEVVTDTALIDELQAGLDRREFELMYGIDHERLQQGGRDLVKGEGNLGNTLFEASAGLTDVKSTLARLESRSGELFKSKGTNPVLNAAAKSYKHDKAELKKVQVSPKAWVTLQKAHQKAQEELDAAKQSLQDHRRERDKYQTLRSSLPTFQTITQARDGIAELQDLPDLPADMRDRRTQAQSGLQDAREQMESNQIALDDNQLELDNIASDDSVLGWRESVEGLSRDLHHYRENTREASELQASIDETSKRLEGMAARLSDQKIESVLSWVPSQGDKQIALDHCERLEDAVSELQSLKGRLESIAEQVSDDPAPDETTSQVDYEAIAQALAEAHPLSDADATLRRYQADINSDDSKLERLLREAGLDGLAQARAVDPIPETTIAEKEALIDDITADGQRLKERLSDAEDAIETAKRDIARLNAGADVITQEQLDSQRKQRDRGWDLVVLRYIEGEKSDALNREIEEYSAGAPLTVTYQRMVSGTDVMADQLHSDVQRATELSQAKANLVSRQSEAGRLTEEIETQRARYQKEQSDWSDLSQQHNYPRAMAPKTLGNWHLKLQAILELAEQIDRQTQQKAALEDQVETVHQKLAKALEHAWIQTQGEFFQALVARAQRWVNKSNEDSGARAEQRRQAELLRKQQTRLVEQQQEAQREVEQAGVQVSEACQSYGLPENAGPRALRRRLDELMEIQRETEEVSKSREKLKAHLDLAKQFEDRCHALAEGLDAELGKDLPAGVERMSNRLQKAITNAEDRQRVQSERRQIKKSLDRSTQKAREHEDTLNQLMGQAGVDSLEALADLEQKLDRRRQLQEKLQHAEDTLAESTNLSEEDLRAQLDEHDKVSLDSKIAELEDRISEGEESVDRARQSEEDARRELNSIDSSDHAARLHEGMAVTASEIQASFSEWSRLTIAQALLKRALATYQERAQGPMVQAASNFFAKITDGRYSRLVPDDQDGQMVLKAKGPEGRLMGIHELSEGTADQLYLALRLAALQLRGKSRGVMPLVLDDVLITADDERAASVLRALDQLSDQTQVFLYTHHHHLIDIARSTLSSGRYQTHDISLPHRETRN